MKMKFNKVLILTSSVLLFSCATTNVSKNKENNIEQDKTNEEKIEVPVIPQEVLDFQAKIDSLNITVLESPKFTTAGRDFKSNYTIQVLDSEGTAVSNLLMNVSFPADKDDSGFVNSVEQISTDENGKISFKSPVTSFGCNSKIDFYPVALEGDYNELTSVNCLNRKISADYKVRGNIVNKGAILFIWDFNEKNKAINNSYELLSELRSTYKITMVGNAPINESSYIGASLTTLYKENYEIVENMYGYLIVGTVKFTQPVEAVEDGSGYLCSLVAEIQAVDMKNGQEVFAKTYTKENIGTNWNTAVSVCKKQLAQTIAEDLVYGL